MTGVAEPALAKAATLAVTPLVSRIRRLAARKGLVAGDIFTSLDLTVGPHQRDYWPVSLLSLMPNGLTQRDVDRFIQSPEMGTFIQQLTACHILDNTPQEDRIHQAIRTTMFAFFPAPHAITEGLTPREANTLVARYEQKLDAYWQEFRKHLTESCGNLANQIIKRTENASQVQTWSYATVAGQILSSIDNSLAALTTDVRDRSSLAWVPRYRELFVDAHSDIEAPDFTARTTDRYDEIFVGPSILEADPGSLRARFTADGRSGSFERFCETLDRAVLLGDPGAGKSTTSTVAAVITAQRTAILPFIVVLRKVDSPAFYLVSVLQEQLRQRYELVADPRSIEKLLHEGGALIVFDGLDEVIENETRLDFAKKIESIAKAYPFLKMLVTCRKVGYRTAQLHSDLFATLLIDPFSEQQIDEYAKKWFRLHSGSSRHEGDVLAHDFLRRCTEMLDLVENPLMLAFMCVLYRGIRSIPEDRPMLYDKCVELLLGIRDRRHGIVEQIPDLAVMKTALSRIAHHEVATGNNGGLTVREIHRDLVPFLAAKVIGQRRAAEFVTELLDRCRGRAWIFTDFGPNARHEDLFTFTHASFREYFSALYFIRTATNATDIVYHLWPLVLSGRSEIYSQVCCSLYEENRIGGASELLVALATNVKRTIPLSNLDEVDIRRTADQLRELKVTRSVAAGYLAGLANCVPLTESAIESIVALAIDQVSHGDSVAIGRMLDPVFKHHDAVMDYLVATVSVRAQGAYYGANDRILWFAIHAGYLMSGSHRRLKIGAKTVEILNQMVAGIRMGSQWSGEGLVHNAIRLEAGDFSAAEFANLSTSTFCRRFISLFESHALPISDVGPESVIFWIFDCFASDSRLTMPVSRAAKLLRALARGLYAQKDKLFELPIPGGVKLIPDHDDMLTRVLRHSAGHSVECRTGIAMLLAAQIELEERFKQSIGTDYRSLFRRWLTERPVEPWMQDFCLRWCLGSTEIWAPDMQSVS
jgi:hypothetical protein